MPTPRKLDFRKAITMRLKGSSYQAIADSCKVDPSTVHAAIAPILKELADNSAVEMYRERQAEIVDGLAARTIAAISKEDLQKAGLRDKVVAAGILIDKSRLIQGQSSANLMIIHSDAVHEACQSWGDGHVNALGAADNGEDEPS